MYYRSLGLNYLIHMELRVPKYISQIFKSGLFISLKTSSSQIYYRSSSLNYLIHIKLWVPKCTSQIFKSGLFISSRTSGSQMYYRSSGLNYLINMELRVPKYTSQIFRSGLFIWNFRFYKYQINLNPIIYNININSLYTIDLTFTIELRYNLHSK